MATSTVPAVKAALLNILRARPNLATIQTEWAHPGDKIEPEAIYFHDTQPNDETAVALGNGSRDEEYTIPVAVDVLNEGDDAQAAETRMWELVVEIEEAVRQNPRMGDVPGLVVAQLAGFEPHNYLVTEGRMSICTVRVACKARKSAV